MPPQPGGRSPTTPTGSTSAITAEHRGRRRQRRSENASQFAHALLDRSHHARCLLDPTVLVRLDLLARDLLRRLVGLARDGRLDATPRR
jgi:hypothetical protein